MGITISSYVAIHPHLTKLCYNIGELTHTHEHSHTVIPPMVARLHLFFWVAYMHFDDLRHFTDQFNILHDTINDIFLNIKFQCQIFTFWFFQGQNKQFTLVKTLATFSMLDSACINTVLHQNHFCCNLFEVLVIWWLDIASIHVAFQCNVFYSVAVAQW